MASKTIQPLLSFDVLTIRRTRFLRVRGREQLRSGGKGSRRKGVRSQYCSGGRGTVRGCGVGRTPWVKTESASVLVVWGVCCLACVNRTEADINPARTSASRRDDLACDGFTIVFLHSSTPRIPPIHCLGLFNGIQEDCQPPLVFLGFRALPSRRQPVYQYAAFTCFTKEAPWGLPRWDNQRARFPARPIRPQPRFGCRVGARTDAVKQVTVRCVGRPHRCSKRISPGARCQRRV